MIDRCCYGYCRLRCLQTGRWHDLVGRQLCLHRYRCRRGSSDFRQFEKVHCLYPDFQHSWDFTLLDVHSSWYPTSSWNRHHLVYRFGYRHGKSFKLDAFFSYENKLTSHFYFPNRFQPSLLPTKNLNPTSWSVALVIHSPTNSSTRGGDIKYQILISHLISYLLYVN